MAIDNLLFKKHMAQAVQQEAKAQAVSQAEREPEIVPPMNLPETTQELAAIETFDSKVRPQTAGEKQRVFKDKMEALDALISADNGINTFTIDDIRRYVKDIMVTLHREPELDAILIDRDVHNILRFIRYVKDQAFDGAVTAQEKRVAKVKKAVGVQKNKEAMRKLLGGLSLSGFSADNTAKVVSESLPNFGEGK